MSGTGADDAHVEQNVSARSGIKIKDVQMNNIDQTVFFPILIFKFHHLAKFVVPQYSNITNQMQVSRREKVERGLRCGKLS